MPEFDPKNSIIGLFTGLLILLFAPCNKSMATTLSFDFQQSQQVITLDESDIDVIACQTGSDPQKSDIEFAINESGKEKLKNHWQEFVLIYIDGKYAATIYVDKPIDNNFVIKGSRHTLA